jgi:hypothetical protein
LLDFVVGAVPRTHLINQDYHHPVGNVRFGVPVRGRESIGRLVVASGKVSQMGNSCAPRSDARMQSPV